MIDSDIVLSWISALGPWITGIAVVWIAIWQLKSQKRIADRQHELEQRIADRQAKLDEDKLRFALFEKRFAVWSSLRDGLGEIGSQDASGYLHKTSKAWNDAQFLFGDDVQEFLKDVVSRISELDVISRKMENVGPHAEKYSGLVDQREEIKTWLVGECYRRSQSLFAKYLRFE